MTGTFSFCQTTFPLLTVLGIDTVVCLRPAQLKTLNSQLALLIEHHASCTATVKKADEVIESYKANEADLKQIISNQGGIITAKDSQIENLTEINKNKKKLWLRKVFYGTGGGIVAGLITGLIIAK